VLDRVGDAALTDDDMARIQQVLVETGALDDVERLIEALTRRAVDALAEARLSGEATRELTELAHFVATRDR
jgi:geranylgeranyl diphosphate synthase type I